MSEAAEERKRNRDIRDSAVSVLESIPQIPIHVTEIKRLIMKEVSQAIGPRKKSLDSSENAIFLVVCFGYKCQERRI